MADGLEVAVALPAYVGWSNVDTGPENVRLYALDKGASPRWDRPVARTVERALLEHYGTPDLVEGSRAVVLVLSSRFVSDELLGRCQRAAEEAVSALLLQEPTT